jgi:hypothetical protein
MFYRLILFNEVVKILDLADLDIRVTVGVVTEDRRLVAAAFVDRDLLRNAMTTDGLAQEAQRRFAIPIGCQHEANCGVGPVDRAIQIFPCAFDPSHSSHPIASAQPEALRTRSECCCVARTSRSRLSGPLVETPGPGSIPE